MNKIVFFLTIFLYFSVNQLDSQAQKKLGKEILVTENTKNYDSIFDKIKKNYGIKVYYQDNNDFFPQSWRNKIVNPKLSIISIAELRRFPFLIAKELSKYSKNTITENLKGIYLAKSLSFYSDNVIFGATNSSDGIYITSNGIEKYYTNEYLTHIFHHEFSSILLRNYKFPQLEWESWNPREFAYSNGGTQALRDKKDKLSGDESLYIQGILSDYSLASFEEDFNVYSGMIFAEPEKFYELTKKYPAIKEKFKIWLSFYNSIDKKFTEKYLFDDKTP